MSSQNRVLGVILLTTLTGWIGFSLPFPVFSHIFLNPVHGVVTPEMDSGLRAALLGVAIALYPLGSVLAAPFLGRLSDVAGRKKVLVAALCGVTGGAMIVALGVTMGSIPLIFLGQLFCGCGEGSLAISQSIAADISSPKTKARNFAYIGVAIDAGFIFGPVLGGVLSDSSIHPAFNAALPFWLACPLFAANAIAVALFLKLPQSAASSVARSGRSVWNMLRDKTLLPAFVLSFLTFWSVMIFFDFFSVYFVQVFATPPAELGIYTALVSMPLIVSGLFVGRFVSRFGSRLTAAVSLVLMAAGTAAFLQPVHLIGLVIPVIVICVGINFGQTATSMIVSDAAGEAEQGQAMGLYRAITIAAGGIAALAGGALAGISPAYPFLTAIAAAVAAFAVLVPRRRRVRSANSRI